MNQRLKFRLIVVASILVGISSFTYGAMTAPKAPVKTVEQSSPSETPVTKKSSLTEQLLGEQQTILDILTIAYPKVKTDYTVNQGKLFDQGQWYGTTLTYKGNDTMNRDTLRVLMQKKNGVWIVRSTPPTPLLSAIDYTDVPKSILQAINQPISLPGSDS